MEKKKWKIAIRILLTIVVLIAVVFITDFCVGHLSRLKTGKEIADVLQPVLTEENKSMHLHVGADVNGESFLFDSDIYMVKDDEISYFVMEPMDVPIYIVENLLFFENGHAFKLAEEMELPEQDYKNLFLQIAAIYEVFDFTCVKTDLETGYSVKVTGEQVQKLLEALGPMGTVLSADADNETTGDAEVSTQAAMDFSMIETLNLEMIARNDRLYEIRMTGDAAVDGSQIAVEIVLSKFQVLEAGAYEIPEAVQQAAATVDESALFNLTEDLYRLFIAFDKLIKQETVNGTVTLKANCGIVDFKNTYNLSEFQNGSAVSSDVEKLQGIENLPEMIGFLCMESEIRSEETSQGHMYTIRLDETSMQKISEMVVPELVDYVIDFSGGNVEILLAEESILSIGISIDGSIRVLFSDVPAEVGVEFKFNTP